MSRNQKLLLAGIFILAAVLRVIVICSRNIQYDDAFSYFLAKQSISEIIKGTAADTMPPLYYFLLHFWQLISKEIWFLRLLSVLMSLGAITFLFLFLFRAFDPIAGLWGAFFAAISPIQIYHAQDIRMYALLAFCGMAYLFFFYLSWNSVNKTSRGKWIWVGLIVFGLGTMYTHNLGIFWIISPIFFLVFKRDWKYLWKFLGSLLIIGMLSLPWLVFVPGQMQKIQTAFWTPRPGLAEIVQAVILLTYNLPAESQIFFYIGAVISLEIFILVVIRSFKMMKSHPNILLLDVMALIPPFLLFITSYITRPVFVIRGFIPAQLVFLGLAGTVTAIDWKKKVGILIAVLVIINSIISLPKLYSFNEFPRSPFRDASAKLNKEIGNGYFVIHDNKLSYFPTSYYLTSPNQVFLKDAPGSANDTFASKSQEAMGIYPMESIESATTGKNKVIFLVFSEAIQEYESKNLTHPITFWLKSNYKLTNQEAVGDLELMYFEKTTP
jgi:mannosyltransferase